MPFLYFSSKIFIGSLKENLNQQDGSELSFRDYPAKAICERYRGKGRRPEAICSISIQLGFFWRQVKWAQRAKGQALANGGVVSFWGAAPALFAGSDFDE
jgi:hypothetical protein